MATIIGSARIDERGKLSGGASGDQKQVAKPDYKGEVSMQEFYVHKKGWFVLRPKNPYFAEDIARKMKEACNNPNLGYDQANRLGVIQNGIGTNVKTECDCSALVRACIKEGTGKDVGNFTTGDEPIVLERSGLFEKRMAYTSGMSLYKGDILVTRTKGHTVIVVDGIARVRKEEKASGSKSIAELAKEIIAGKWGTGSERKRKLVQAGYDFREVQEEVNRILGK